MAFYFRVLLSPITYLFAEKSHVTRGRSKLQIVLPTNRFDCHWFSRKASDLYERVNSHEHCANEGPAHYERNPERAFEGTGEIVIDPHSHL